MIHVMQLTGVRILMLSCILMRTLQERSYPTYFLPMVTCGLSPAIATWTHQQPGAWRSTSNPCTASTGHMTTGSGSCRVVVLAEERMEEAGVQCVERGSRWTRLTWPVDSLDIREHTSGATLLTLSTYDSQIYYPCIITLASIALAISPYSDML